MIKKILSIIAISAITLPLIFSSCRDPKKKEEPNNPDTTDTTKVDPNNPDENGDTISTFKPLLKFASDGTLAEIPIPFVEFGASQDAILKWEKEYGSQCENKGTAIVVKTLDPDNKQPMRVYEVKEGKLKQSSIALLPQYIFSSTNTLTDEMELLLNKDGYQPIENEKGLLIYNNGKLMLSFSSTTEGKWALITYMPSPSSPVSKFDPALKDFPLLLKNTKIEEYKVDEIKAHETKLGVRTLNTTKSTATKLIFTNSEGKTNFQEVTYNLVAGSYGGDIKVMSQSLNFEMARTEDFKQYMKNNGFEFEKEQTMQGIQFIKYINKTLAVRCEINDAMGKSNQLGMFFVYAPDLLDPNEDDPETEKIREALYLPIFSWGAELSEKSPLLEQEKARKFTAKFKPAGEDQYGPIPASIESEPPFDKDYSFSLGTKPGLIGFIYKYDKYNNTDKYSSSQVSHVQLIFNKVWIKEQRPGNHPELKNFLEKNGFEYKGSQKAAYGDALNHEYYNATKKVYAVFTTGNIFGSFDILAEMRPLEVWNATTVAEVRAAVALNRRNIQPHR